MTNETINYLREQRKRHLEAIESINRKADEFLKQYQKAVDIEIQGVEYCEDVLSQAGVPFEEHTDTAENAEETAVEGDVVELVEEYTDDDCVANDGATDAQ